MKKIDRLILIASYSWSAWLFAAPTVIIDPGHEPSRWGSVGVCHEKEVDYNDQLSARAAQVLSNEYHVILTRKMQQNVMITNIDYKKLLPQSEWHSWQRDPSLIARAIIANQAHANIFISIHHDSVAQKQKVFDPLVCHGTGGYIINPDFKKQYQIGYDIFVDNDGTPRAKASLKLAENIAKQLQAMQRIPANYHVYPADDCRSCVPINQKLGIWYQNLAVLRDTHMPAVLIEVGNIVDVNDEKTINNPTFRAKFSNALNKAIRNYFA